MIGAKEPKLDGTDGLALGFFTARPRDANLSRNLVRIRNDSIPHSGSLDFMALKSSHVQRSGFLCRKSRAVKL